jgi:hypothetical protein
MHGRDIRDRLRHQAAVHTFLAGRVNIPDAEPLFEHADNLYLPLSHIDGRDFANRAAVPYRMLTLIEQRSLLLELEQVLETVARLHRENCIHRDLSPRNIRIGVDGKVYLLDLELCHIPGVSELSPFSQGTPGFTSPQQIVGERPSVSDDIFSLGSLMILATTGLDPQRVLYATPQYRLDQLVSLSGAPILLCSIVADCVSPQVEKRPSIEAVAATLREVRDSLVDSPDVETSSRLQSLKPSDCDRDLILSSLRWLLVGAPRDEVHAQWISPEIESSKHDATLRLPDAYRLYRSASRGVAGVVYVLCRLHRMGYAVESSQTVVGGAIDWLLDHHPTPDDQMPGLHFGEAGVAVAIAEAVRSGLIDSGEWLLPYLREALGGPIDWPDLTHGAAGQGIAALYCSATLNDPGLSNQAAACAQYLVEQQGTDGCWSLPEGVPGMEGVIYTGLAHGVAGIAYFLAVFGRNTNAEAAKRSAKRAGEWLLGQSRTDDNGHSLWWPLEKDGVESWRWWCHGSPGIAVALLALFELTSDNRFSSAARAALRAHPFDVRHSNLSQCHGLAGLGEVYLEAYRVLGDDEWIARARNIGMTLRALARKDEHGDSWLVENPFTPTADLMIGCGGIAHFLARLSLQQTSVYGMPLMIEYTANV